MFPIPAGGDLRRLCFLFVACVWASSNTASVRCAARQSRTESKTFHDPNPLGPQLIAGGVRALAAPCSAFSVASLLAGLQPARLAYVGLSEVRRCRAYIRRRQVGIARPRDIWYQGIHCSLLTRSAFLQGFLAVQAPDQAQRNVPCPTSARLPWRLRTLTMVRAALSSVRCQQVLLHGGMVCSAAR